MSTLAAILYDPGFRIDDFMAALASRLKDGGVRLGGVVQHNAGACDSGCLTMALEDLATGARFPISEDRGAGATGCRLDATGLAAAAGALAVTLDGGADLVIINKFGRQEMLGQGLRQEIAAALLADMPLLIAVRRDLMPAWRDFAGDEWVELAPDMAQVEAWALTRLRLAA
ncbi:DUF2478 domain-containing protein [Bosea sp. PAMC 26642]|uniref:DUF2478 domain-containing protein n=1 Tax=Bosea sp. (strain PAMC 26642) TaxID=1792307 RepID=UPI0007704C34|nr:DUF2478 domain-containing protein [Bosea sp. PAMC 26642]AMJ63328.1 hypothetical protein AXW83_26205 [Bosea sp. PAMC 26642]